MSALGSEWISDRSREGSPTGRDSPEGNPGPSQQRTSKKRKVLSCYACRDRKLKCDRVFPVCGRCQKTGRRNECTYDPRLLEESHVSAGAQADGGAPYVLAERPADSNAPVDTSDTLRGRIRAQEKRIAVLEQQLAQHRTRNTSQYKDMVLEEPTLREEFMFRGKGFKTIFTGHTSIMSIISTYHELQVFIREALNVDHSIMRIKDDFKAFRDRRKKAAREHPIGGDGTDANIFAMLPEKSIMDAQAALYFRTWETSYRILHEPSFWEEYRAFWEGTRTDKERVAFAAVLVLIIAITKCLKPKDDTFVGDTTADRQAANDFIEVCENWMNRQPRRRVTLSFFQIRCLLLLSKRANGIGFKQDWVASGELFRIALASGMHRDPALLGTDSISPFDAEMKKRLWVTVVELELQSSVEAGIQSGLTALYFDAPAPAHLPDEAFSTNTQEMPSGQPEGDFTSASYLNASLKSLPLRIHLTQLLNTSFASTQYIDALHLDAQIHAAISALPEWSSESAAVPSALLRLQLQQYLLILHKPFAKLASRNSRFMYSLTTCVDTCNSIVGTHGDLLSKGILALSNLRNDIVRVGLTLSQVVFHNCTLSMVKSSVAPASNSDTQLADPQAHFADLSMVKSQRPICGTLYFATLPQESFIVKTLCTSSIEILERTRHTFEQKVLRLGTGYMEFWLMSAAVGMLPPPPSPATSITYINNGSDDILSRCRKSLDSFTTLAYRILALQQNQKDGLASSLRDTTTNASQSEGRTPSTAGTMSGYGPTPAAYEHTGFTQINGIGAGPSAENASKDMNAPFDMLQDMQMDGSGWSFPDFWAFDLGGEF